MMHVTAPRRDILRLVLRAGSVADRRSTMPALAGVLLAADADALTVTGTDLYLAASGSCSADVARPGRVVLSARDLAERLKLMPEGKVTLRATDRAMEISGIGTKRRHTMPAMPADEYPPIPSCVDPGITGSIPAAAIAIAISQTVSWVSQEAERPQGGLLISWSPDKVRAVACNGHCLACADAPGTDVRGDGTILVPLVGVRALAALLADAPDGAALGIAKSGGSVFFDVDGSHLSTKIAHDVSAFPPWSQVIPASPSRKAIVERAAMVGAIRSASLSSDPDGSKPVDVSVGEDSLTITGKSSERGDSVDAVPATVTGKPVTVRVSSTYLLDALAAVGTADDVTIETGKELEPMLVRNGGSYLGVIMPMRQ